MKNHGFALALLMSAVVLSGCAGYNRFATKLDAVAGRLAQPGTHEYEGHLAVSREVGAMTALQFDDGKTFDVIEAPSALVAGDVVRVYRTEKGFVARLWQPITESAGVPPPVTRVQSN